jgi:hypothetical protein
MFYDVLNIPAEYDKDTSSAKFKAFSPNSRFATRCLPLFVPAGQCS